MADSDPDPTPDDDDSLWHEAAIPQLVAVALCAFLVFSFFVLILFLFGFWPEVAGSGKEWSTGFRWFWWKSGLAIDPGQRLLVVVLICGGLGAQVHTIVSFAFHMARRDFSRDWIYWYILRPFQGAIVAFVVYFVFAAGLAGELTTAVPAKGADDATENARRLAGMMTDLYRAGAISALVGMFSESATEKLRQIANTVLARPMPKAAKKPASAPTLTADPAAVSAAPNQQVALKGTGLDRVKKVEIGKLAATLPEAAKRTPTSLPVTVDGAALGAGDHAIKLDGKDTGRKVKVA